MTGVLEIVGSFAFVLSFKISVGTFRDTPAWKSFLIGTGLPSPPGLWGRASQGPDARCLSSAGRAVCGGTGSWRPDRWTSSHPLSGRFLLWVQPQDRRTDTQGRLQDSGTAGRWGWEREEVAASGALRLFPSTPTPPHAPQIVGRRIVWEFKADAQRHHLQIA